MRVFYEWDVETSDADGDILDHAFCTTYAEAQALASRVPRSEVVLVRDTEDGGRSWAYVRDGALPLVFTDADGLGVAQVPTRFHREVEKSSPRLTNLFA